MRTFIPSNLQRMRNELYQRGEPTPEYFGEIGKHHLVIPTVQAHGGIFAVCLCWFADNGEDAVFDFSADGVPVAVIECLNEDGETPVDLIAWPLAAPEYFATAIRKAEMLGTWGMTGRGGMPLPIFRTPLDWIKAGCEGCAPISLQRAGYRLDKAGGPFIARDLAHGRELRHMLGDTAHQHTILIPSHSNTEAA